MIMLPLPDDFRRDVRAANHPNRAAEDEAVYAADHATFDKVRVLERLLVEQGEALYKRTTEALDGVEGTISSVGELSQGLRHGKVAATQDTARQYGAIRGQIQANLAHLESLRTQIIHTSDRCADPMAALQDTLSRFPALRSGRAYTVPEYAKKRHS